MTVQMFREHLEDERADVRESRNDGRGQVDQFWRHSAAMCVQPEAVERLASSDVHFPYTFQRHLGDGIQRPLPAIPLVAKEVMEIEQYAAVGELRHFSEEAAIIEMTVNRSQVVHTRFKGDG